MTIRCAVVSDDGDVVKDFVVVAWYFEVVHVEDGEVDVLVLVVEDDVGVVDVVELVVLGVLVVLVLVVVVVGRVGMVTSRGAVVPVGGMESSDVLFDVYLPYPPAKTSPIFKPLKTSFRIIHTTLK